MWVECSTWTLSCWKVINRPFVNVCPGFVWNGNGFSYVPLRIVLSSKSYASCSDALIAHQDKYRYLRKSDYKYVDLYNMKAKK